MRKKLYILLGSFSIGVGVLGIFLPLLPTTPFLLVSAWSFSKSSEKLEKWLLNHRIFGRYITNYKINHGMSRRHKYMTLTLLWAGIGYAIYLSHKSTTAIIVLSIILFAVSLHILLLGTVE